MGKVVMPKHSGDLSETLAALKIYYDHGNWLTNATFKKELKKAIGSGQYSSSYTKKVQIPSYFGFTVWQDINRTTSPRKITDGGKEFYVALSTGNNNVAYEYIVKSLQNVTFGRKNCGAPESDSDVEPPCLAIRGIIDLGYLTRSEFGFLLYSVADAGTNYSAAIRAIKNARATHINLRLNIPQQYRSSYTDIKPFLFLQNIGFFVPDHQKYIINPSVLGRFKTIFKSLPIYNTNKPNINTNLTKKDSGLFGGTISSTGKIDPLSGEGIKETFADFEDDFAIHNASAYSSQSEIDASNARIPTLKPGTSTNKRYTTDPRLAKTALINANWKCALDGFDGHVHSTFNTSAGNKYLEAHHLVPMKAQKDFDPTNIDIYDNIIPLCPNCHKAVHYGSLTEKRRFLKPLYYSRITKLNTSGINISFDDLINKYYS